MLHPNQHLYSLQRTPYRGSVPHPRPSHRDSIFAISTAALTHNKWDPLVLRRLPLRMGLILAAPSLLIAPALHPLH